MAELTAKERLQPSLLDRLTDDEPEQTQESREQRVLSLRRLRECVLRDLGWLFNAGNLTGLVDLSAHPEVARSVVNYGLRDLSGVTATTVDVKELERTIAQCIRDFEPRILPASLTVRAVVARDQMNTNAVSFEIRGELWAIPVPVELFVRTEIDLEDGQVSVYDVQGRA